MVELLKQGQYAPLPVDKQVIALFAGVNGYLDDVDPAQVPRFEKELLAFMDEKYPDVVRTLADTAKIDDDLDAKIRKAIEDFKTGFSAG